MLLCYAIVKACKKDWCNSFDIQIYRNSIKSQLINTSMLFYNTKYKQQWEQQTTLSTTWLWGCGMS